MSYLKGIGLKLDPFYAFLEDWLKRNYVLKVASRKRAFYEFASRYGKVRVLIGLAAGEEGRIESASEDALDENGRPKGKKWMRETIERVYPLAEIRWDRAACQTYIASCGLPVPPPSACLRCPWANDVELLYLWHFHRAKYDEWVEREAAKLKKWAHLGEKNVGVWGSTAALPAVLDRLKAKYPQYVADPALLAEYRQSHGHCVKSKF